MIETDNRELTSLPDNRNHDARARGWVWLFGLSALEGLAALIYLVTLPADAENAFWLGFSARRLALIAVLLTISIICAVLAWAGADPRRHARWLDPSRRSAWFKTLLLFMPVLATASGLVMLVLMSLYRTSGDFRYFAYYERLQPLLVWIGLFALQSTLWLAWAGGFNWAALRTQRNVFRAGTAVLGLFLIAWLLVAFTGIGITPDRIGWGAPAVPLLEWQIWLSLILGSVFFLFLAFTGPTRRWTARHDFLMAVAIGALAAVVWLSQPVHTAFFATAGREPNFEIYPFSDGAYYGLFAQNVLIGNGFQGSQVPPRPFYITLLALFHAVAGQSYEQVVFVQTLVLALFPVVLYFIGKELHSRPVGLIIALLAIFRELTAMITAPITDKASTSQLFFADLPSALAISLWALIAIRWLKAADLEQRRQPLVLPLLMGGSMGLAMLFRTQSIFMLPAVLLLAFFALLGRWRSWLIQTMLILLGLLLMIIPWLWRNYQVTGTLAFDDPKSQTGVMAQRYTLTEERGLEEEFVIRPDEDLVEFSERVNQGIFEFMLTNPGEVARFVSAHLVNAEIDNLLLLPVRDGLNSPGDLFMPDRAFWQSWTGVPSLLQGLLMALNLALLALGVGAAWTRHRWAGLALLLMSISYNASNALARNSGLRYLLPVDWMVYSYAALGLFQLVITVSLLLGIAPERLKLALGSGGTNEAPSAKPARAIWRSAALVGIALLLVGSIPPLVERAFPRLYPLQTQTELTVEFLQSPVLQASQPDLLAVERFLQQPRARVVKGRALYPRFYAAGDGEPRTAKLGYEPLDFSRGLFLIASNSFNGLVMLRSEQPPAYLPNTADVLVLGCDQTNYIEASLVLVLTQPGGMYQADQGIPASCPAVEAD